MFSRLYLHIPWCLSKCNYCAFNSRPLEPEKLQQTCDLLLIEMELAAAAFPVDQPLQSLYLGGGTPSLLTAAQVHSLILRSRELFGHDHTIEITLEANPGTIGTDSCRGYRQAGVTRLSLGAQSFLDDELTLLGRPHTAIAVVDAVQSARDAEFCSIGLDLICGLPGQTDTDWQYNLNTAVSLQPEHLSIYGLTIEEGTPFALRYPEGTAGLPDDDQTATMLEEADRLLCGTGYEHYEIANFSRPGFRSEHNCGYWQRDGYLGIGPGAHSLLLQGWGVRRSNRASYEQWSAAVQSGSLAAVAQEQQQLTRNDALSEALFLGLRMADGIQPDRFAEQFGERLEQLFAKDLEQLQQVGLVTCTTHRLSLTSKGMLLSNQVFARFV